jgi:2-methylisocitrate lyase-like PEP mutase family enzyme
MGRRVPIPMSTAERRARLRELVASGKTTVALGATDALSAKIIESHGFDCVYIGSYATAASRFGLPDTGLLSLEPLVEQARTLAQAVNLPVIADAEGGFNDPANMWRTVQAFEEAGVAAIHIEDHTGSGKHTSRPQSLRPMAEAAERIRAAVAARKDPNFMVIARCDAYWISRDLDDCIARLKAYANAGADMVFPTLLDAKHFPRLRRATGKPLMIVDIPGEGFGAHEAAAIVLYYAFSTVTQFDALNKALEVFKAAHDVHAGADYGKLIATFEKFMGYR